MHAENDGDCVVYVMFVILEKKLITNYIVDECSLAFVII